MMPRASCSLSRNVSCACRLSVMSRPMKKYRLTGSDHAPVHDRVTIRPSLWMKRVSKFRVRCPPPRGAHFVAGVVEIVGMDEFDRIETDHLLGLVSQYGFATRADLNQNALAVGDQDQVLGGLEDAAPFLDLLASARSVLLAFGDVADDLGCADDLARRRP